MKKRLSNHHLSQPIETLVPDSERLIRALEDVFSRSSPGSWPLGEVIQQSDVRKMVEDCNEHFINAEIPIVELSTITAGQIS
jgi:hypothetical protein